MFTHLRVRSARRWTIAVGIVVTVAAGTAGAVLLEAPSPVGTPPSEITPLAATLLSPPRPVLGDDDRQHLAYEIFVTNPTSSLMTLDRIEALDDTTVVGTLTGADLDTAIHPLVPNSAKSLSPAQVSRVFLDTTFPRRSRIPRSLTHRFTFTLTPTAGAPTTATVVSAPTVVERDDPVEIDPPLAGARWVTSGGCCFPPSYHRTATLPVNGAFHGPERFAIDFVQLDDDNRLYDGDVHALSSYGYFGASVMAVANGRVVGELDGIPESTPPDFPDGATAETAGGNYVVIDIGDGRFAYYAHMQPGSLRVHVGDRVRRGQVIGRLGNTGNSNAPHLHFQITDGPIPLASEGLPFVFRDFTTRGTIANIDDVENTGAAATLTPTNAGRHHDRLPLQNELIDFTTR